MNAAHITVVTNFDSSRPAGRAWRAWIYLGDKVQTTADGRDQGAAVADAVAKFRTARGCRMAERRAAAELTRLSVALCGGGAEDRGRVGLSWRARPV